jgi:hypothetical protein
VSWYGAVDVKTRYFSLGWAAALLLAACALPSQIAAPSGAEASGSWMSSRATTENLLYISDVGTNEVYVYTYPQGELVGKLKGFESPVRDCADSAGNVYITNTAKGTIVEYAHAATKATAIFRDTGFLPIDCSVDPSTHTLAVANDVPSESNESSVAIYEDGESQAKFYRAPNVEAYLFCAYDDAGNLYVDGLDRGYNFVLIELPKGATTFQTIALNQRLKSWGGIEWDGGYVAISDGASTIYDFAVNGTKARKARTVLLKHGINVVQFWIDGSTLIGPDGPDGGRHDVGFWNYPHGFGTKNIGNGVLKNPSSAAVSIAP